MRKRWTGKQWYTWPGFMALDQHTSKPRDYRIPKMADNNNTTKSKLLFMLIFIVLDNFHERIVVCDKHRDFYNLQSLRMGYINV